MNFEFKTHQRQFVKCHLFYFETKENAFVQIFDL